MNSTPVEKLASAEATNTRIACHRRPILLKPAAR
jgi:hypothetical protein